MNEKQYRSILADMQELLGLLTAICRTTNTK